VKRGNRVPHGISPVSFGALMKKLLSFLVLLLTGCAAPLPQTPPAGFSAQVSAPAIRAGQTLRYTARDGYTGLPQPDIIYRVTRVEGDTVTVEAQRGNRSWTERYTPEWNWLERPMTNLRNFRYSPPYPALSFPLAARKTWHGYVQATDPVTGRVNRVRVDGKVLGWERVTVPAGEFDTLKIERYVYAGNAEFFRMEERIREYDWYAPKAGIVVRHEESSEYTDTSRSCWFANCMLILNDWTVMELASHGTSP
jgi:hypothetical protein